MTWKQFKDEVDRQLANKNISEDEEIWYIDVAWERMDASDLTVMIDENIGLSIS